ncbi:hypothetical protein ACLOJK_015210 [Asimina triloba]
MKAIVNPPDPTLGWESRFFFAWLSLERGIWGIPEQWEEPFLARSLDHMRGYLLFSGGPEEFFHWCELVHFVTVEKRKKCAPKRAHSLGERSILVDSDSSTEDAPKLSPIGGSPTAIDRVDIKRAFSPQEFLREELEASRAEVVRLQLLLRGGGVRSSVVAYYLQSDAYRRQVEFERAHHSHGGYVRALADIIFHFAPLIELAEGFSYVVTLKEILVCGGMPMSASSLVLDQGLPIMAGPTIFSTRIAYVGRGSPIVAEPAVFSTRVTYVGGSPGVGSGVAYSGWTHCL